MGRDPENSKIKNLQMFAKIRRFLRKFADFSKFAHFCENLQIFAKISRFLRKYPDFCENIPIFAKIYRFLRKCADFCENIFDFCEKMSIFAKICENLQIFAKRGQLRMLDILDNLTVSANVTAV